MFLIKYLIATVFFIFSCNLYSQNACAGINLGQDTSIDCSQSCITLNSSVLDVGLTTNYNIYNIPFNPPYLFTQGNSIFVNRDDIFSSLIQLPFIFCFYGNNYDKIVVGANGVISFDSLLANRWCEWEFDSIIPNTVGEPYRNSINAPYHDLNPRIGGNVRYSVVGNYPCRTFVVNFDRVPHYDCSSITSTFQVVLYETTNIIEIYILDKPICSSWNNGNSVLGIQNSSGTIAHVPANRNTSNWTTNNEAWRFVPSGGSSINSVQWYDENGNLIGNGDSINVCPVDSSSYSATITYNTCYGTQVVEKDTINVNVSKYGGKKVEINIQDSLICFGDSIILYGLNSMTYLWNNGVLDSIYFYPQQTDYYVVNAIDSNGCKSSDSVLITINNSYLVDTNIVSCDSILFSGNYFYSTGIYDLFDTSTSGCDSINRLNLTLNSSTYSSVSITSCENLIWNNNFYDTTGQYYFTTQNNIGCDSVIMLDLKINPSSVSSIYIDKCDLFNWNNQIYTTSGLYSSLFIDSKGCDSLVNLNLTINQSTNSFSTITSCGPVLWNGIQYNNSGQYLYMTTNSDGCDSIANLDLVIYSPTSSTSNIISCDSYYWNNQNYVNSGTYSFSTQGINGCDSTAYLFLTINKSSYSFNNIQSCNQIIWNNNIYDSTGTFYFITSNSVGCDSSAILNLEITNTILSFDTVTACETYFWNEKTYNISGNYSFDTINDSGCDSTANLYLIIKKNTTSFSNHEACDNFEWNNQIYYNSGTYQRNLVNESGCDSLAILNLIINNSSFSSNSISSCDNFIWNNLNYETSGTYQYITTNQFGCDSTATLNLTIKNTQESFYDTSICLGSSIYWNGETYFENGTYLFKSIASNGCDSIAYLNLNTNVSSTTYYNQTSCEEFEWKNNLYTESGLYSHVSGNGQGCDSLYILNLTINSISVSNDTIRSCNNFYWRGSVFNESGNYILNSINEFGCDSFIYLKLIIDEINTVLPNTFTPNDDILNDNFAVFKNEIDNYELSIYNRIGEKIFHSNNSTIGWNGKFKGSSVQDGMYVWKIKYTCSGEFNEKIGFVSIIK